MKKIIIYIVCAVLLVGSFVTKVSAGDKYEHDQALKSVLIGSKSTFDNKNALGSLQLLQDASQLAIDSNQQQATLDKLRNEVKGLPKSVAEFNGKGTGGKTHRNYTHKGWDYDYGNNDLAHWKDMRKDILLKTVNDVFDFGLLSGMPFCDYDEKCNSFAALVYYVHIIVDHTSNQRFYKEYEEIPLIKGKYDSFGIIEELEKHCGILFSDIKDTKEYNRLMLDLKERKRAIRKVYLSRNDLFNEENYEIYHGEANRLMEDLKSDIPKLLEKEKFFSEVFY